MRISESKNKRMHIMQQISFRQQSKERQRKSSAQRRGIIESNLNDFVKTMSNLSFKNTGNSQAFRYEHPYSQKPGSHSQLQKEKTDLRNEYDQVLRSPSFKDINIARQDESQMQVSGESVKFSNLMHKQPKQPIHESENMIEEEQITYNTKGDQEIQKLTPKSIAQNESSASGIFFTSQFNQFISKNHLSSRQQLIQPLTNPSQNVTIQREGQAERQIQNTSNPFQTKLTPEQSSKVRFQVNHGEYVYDQIAQTQNDLDPIPQTIEQQNKENLIKNKSAHSLAFSNQSSLKYSLNESNIKEILNRKFAHQLIADNNHFDSSNPNESLYHHLKLQIIAEKFISNHWRSLFQEFTLLAKVLIFQKKVQKRQKRMYFDAFIVNKELNFEQKKNKIVCDKYLLQKQQIQLKKVFDSLKFEYFSIPKLKYHNAVEFQEENSKVLKEKIFRCLKIAWFDQKVKRQIELFYLSKIFSHFARVIKTQKQQQRNKCLSFYCSNLKKRFFRHLKEGVDALQTERIQRDNAHWHYAFGLQRKVFDAWKDKLSYKERYISLAMTTKNTFKQTGDQKWLQIRTVDFRQIK